VEDLDLSKNDITDITPISGMTKLEGLNILSNNQLSDLTPISGLINLTNIDMRTTMVSDLTPLYGLTNLKTIHVDTTYITTEEAEAFSAVVPNCWIEWFEEPKE